MQNDKIKIIDILNVICYNIQVWKIHTFSDSPEVAVFCRAVFGEDEGNGGTGAFANAQCAQIKKQEETKWQT